MNYDDFPILDDTSYTIMREQFQSNQSSAHELIANIFNNLSMLSSAEINDLNHFNKSIINSLNHNKENIQISSQNLIKLFNLNQNLHTKKMNIFSYLNTEIRICIDISSVVDKIEKTYHKHILIQIRENLLSSISDILSSLETTKIHFFKYL